MTPTKSADRPLAGLVAGEGDHPARRVEGLDAIRGELDAGRPIWIDVEDPSDKDLDRIRTVFPFHPLAIEDVLHAVQRPKIEEYERSLFIVAFEFRLNGGTDFAPMEVDAFLGDGYLVTFHGQPVSAIADVWERCASGRLSFHQGADRLLYAVLDALIDGCFTLLERFDERIEKIEHRILSEVDRELLGEIFETRRDLLEFRRILVPHRELLNHLASREYAWVTQAVRTYFRDVQDHATRISEAADGFRELLNTGVETYLSQAAERTNQVMKLLAIIATLGLPLTVLTGFFGMNFDHLPGLHEPLGVGILLVGMVVIEAALLVVFRRKGWL